MFNFLDDLYLTNWYRKLFLESQYLDLFKKENEVLDEYIWIMSTKVSYSADVYVTNM